MNLHNHPPTLPSRIALCVCCVRQFLCLAMDLYRGGSLYQQLERTMDFGERRARFHAAELLLALEHLHRQKIAHRRGLSIAGDAHQVTRCCIQRLCTCSGEGR
jgi:serine/threonine protein kinase